MPVPALASWISRLSNSDLLVETVGLPGCSRSNLEAEPLQLEVAATNMIARQNATILKFVVILAIPPLRRQLEYGW